MLIAGTNIVLGIQNEQYIHFQLYLWQAAPLCNQFYFIDILQKAIRVCARARERTRSHLWAIVACVYHSGTV